jgi:NTP pyrophosphatase (non-canonical NTP hydrolase)
MTPNEYQQAALRTEKTPLFTNDADGVPSLRLSRMMHALLGLNTEQAEMHTALIDHLAFGTELDLVNFAEETGDQLWYIALGLDAIGMTMEHALGNVDLLARWETLRLDTPSFIVATGDESQRQLALLSEAHAGMNIHQAEAADVYKKHFIYGKPINERALCQMFRDQLVYAYVAARAAGSSLEEVMERNIAKLKARYPEKFTQEQALNRDLETERAILEGK